MTINAATLVILWAGSVLLAAWGAYLLGWRDAEYVQKHFAGFDRAVLSLRARGFRR